MRTARRNKTALILVTVILAALVAALVIGLLSKLHCKWRKSFNNI